MTLLICLFLFIVIVLVVAANMPREWLGDSVSDETYKKLHLEQIAREEQAKRRRTIAAECRPAAMISLANRIHETYGVSLEVAKAFVEKEAFYASRWGHADAWILTACPPQEEKYQIAVKLHKFGASVKPALIRMLKEDAKGDIVSQRPRIIENADLNAAVMSIVLQD